MAGVLTLASVVPAGGCPFSWAAQAGLEPHRRFWEIRLVYGVARYIVAGGL